jgi:hypothetical protein
MGRKNASSVLNDEDTISKKREAFQNFDESGGEIGLQ